MRRIERIRHPVSGSPMSSWLGSRPTGALRIAFRLPVYLYHLNLGRLLGHRCLLLIHQGRKSGLLRETVLEVIRHDPATQQSIVISGWGEKTDWYRNIKASPALEVRIAHRRYVPEQRFLDPEENRAVISDYARRHPLAFRFFARVLGYPLAGTEEERQRFVKSLRLVALRPRGEAEGPSSPVEHEGIRREGTG